MSPLSEEERRALLARAEKVRAESEARIAEWRAAGSPDLGISSEKVRFRQGGDAMLRPTADGGVEAYFAKGPELRAVSNPPGDYDRWANPTEQAWARRTFIARKAAWLWGDLQGPEPEGPGDGTDVALSGEGDGVVITYPDGSRLWRDRQWRIHREGGPAVRRREPDGGVREETWREGVRVDPPIDPTTWADR